MTVVGEGVGRANGKTCGERLTGCGGSGGLFALRAQERKVRADAAAAGAQTEEPAKALDQEVRALVEAAQTLANDGAATAGTAVVNGKGWMLAMAGGSILAAFLIGWLYVRRNPTRRLNALAGSMRAIAGGDLQATIPSGGSDESTEMAEALVVFRDTSAEAEATRTRAEEERREASARSEEHTSELQSLMRISYAVFCLKKKKKK